MGWKIKTQLPTTAQDTLGKFVPGFTVTFMMDSGQVGSVFVPEYEYNAEMVRARVSARAAVLAEVAALEG